MRTSTLAPDAIEALLARAEKSTRRAPLCAAQVALARDGELIACASFGRARFGGAAREERAADARTLFCIYSVTKAIVAAASWILLQEGKLALADRVADHIPEFGTHGKDVVTVEQLLTHTAGFPAANLPTADWPDAERRVRHLETWRLEWEPGSRFVYHSSATLWALAELITRAGGQVAWADPESGLSFVFLTNAAEKNPARQGANGFRLSTLAAAYTR